MFDRSSISIVLRKSKTLAYLFLALGAILTSFVVMASLSFLLQLLLIVLVVGVLGRAIRLHGLKMGPTAVVELHKLNEVDWRIHLASGEERLATLAVDSIFTASLLILNFNSYGKKNKITVMIARDSLAPDQFRRLKVLLAL